MSYGQYGGAQGGGYGQSGGGAPPAYGAQGGYGGQGGYGPGGFYSTPSGPPPGADPEVWNMFQAVDRGGDGYGRGNGQIDVSELQRALINGDWTPFDLDTVKLLMNMFDTDRSGTIGFNEFAGLWNYIKDWQAVYSHFDQDKSGTIDQHELSNALHQFGYNLSPRMIDLVERKYANAAQGRNAGITFDRFVRACVVIKQLTETFNRMKGPNPYVQMDYETFMQTVLILP